MTWANWLNVLVKRSAQNSLHIFDVESRTLPTMTLRRSTLAFIASETVHKILIQLMTIWIRLLITRTLIIEILLKLFIGQVEACTISHVHHKTSRGKTLSLLFLNTSDLLFWMTDRSVMLLRLLLNHLILN